MRSAAAGFVLSLWLASCTSTARITGDFGDYRSYRQTRLGATLEERLAASQRYLRDFPHGDYHEQVRSWFSPTERRYYTLSLNNLPRLRAYLDAMPDGPHAAAVSQRIGELESRRVFADRRDQHLLDVAHQFELHLAEAAAQRRELLREFTNLTRLLGATRSFGKPISALEPELLVRFRSPPAGSCTEDGCEKPFAFPYAVPDERELTNRVAQLSLRLTLERGLLRELSLSGPELFTRLAEAVDVRVISAKNPQARAEALGHALELIADALDQSLPKAHCEVGVVSPVILARRCNGLRLEVVAGTEAGGLDRLSLSRGRP